MDGYESMMIEKAAPQENDSWETLIAECGNVLTLNVQTFER